VLLLIKVYAVYLLILLRFITRSFFLIYILVVLWCITIGDGYIVGICHLLLGCHVHWKGFSDETKENNKQYCEQFNEQLLPHCSMQN
jgi:hypothetical protein